MAQITGLPLAKSNSTRARLLYTCSIRTSSRDSPRARRVQDGNFARVSARVPYMLRFFHVNGRGVFSLNVLGSFGVFPGTNYWKCTFAEGIGEKYG